MPATERFRKEHNPDAERWMPNITLIEPFVSAKQDQDVQFVTKAISNIVRHQQPFKFKFDGIEEFVHRGKKRSLWLKPDHESWRELKNLVDWLLKAMPDYKDIRPHSTFSPRLTLGQFDNQKSLEDAVIQYKDELLRETQISFEATQLAWVTRLGHKDKMTVQQTFPLGGEL